MPKNRIIYLGVLVTAGSALLWVGAVFLAAIKDQLIWFGLVGIALIVTGVILEARKGKIPPADADPHQG